MAGPPCCRLSKTRAAGFHRSITGFAEGKEAVRQAGHFLIAPLKTPIVCLRYEKLLAPCCAWCVHWSLHGALCQTDDVDIVLDFQETADLGDLVGMREQRLYL